MFIYLGVISRPINMFKLKKKLCEDLIKNLVFIIMLSYMYGNVIQSSLSKLQKLNTLFFVCHNF